MTNEFALSRNIDVATGRIAVESNGPSLWQRIVTWFEDRQRYEETLTELEKMSDRELDDVGVSRYDLRSAAWDAVYGHAGR